MKVIFSVTVGASAYSLLRGQLRWFALNKADVILVTSPDSAAIKAARREGVKLHGLPMKREIAIGSDVIALFRWIRLLLIHRPDVINVGTPKASLLAGLAGWLTRIPRRVYVVRGLRLEGARGSHQKLLWLAEKVTIMVATDVVVVSRSLGQQLVARRLIPPGRAILIGHGSSNGVDVDAIRARTDPVRKLDRRAELGMNETSFVIGYIGRITPDKGLDTLLDAWEKLKGHGEFELLLIGETEDGDLSSRISRMGSGVHVLDWTDDVWSYLPVMDILSLPTRREGFPNVVLEAASAGVPCITTRATGAVDSVVDGLTGFLVDPDDAVGLATRIQQLAGDRGLLRVLGESARRRASEDFRPARIWRGMLAVMENHQAHADLHRIGPVEQVKFNV